MSFKVVILNHNSHLDIQILPDICKVTIQCIAPKRGTLESKKGIINNYDGTKAKIRTVPGKLMYTGTLDMCKNAITIVIP